MSKWSWTVGKFWGTELRLHASLLLLIPYGIVAFRPETLSDALRVFLLIAAIFACVMLHEAGHTAAARLFHIEVSNITLWPLGGFANLARRPEKTWQNIVVVAAGPATNLVLSLILIALALIDRAMLSSLALPGVSLWLLRVNFFPFLMGLIIANLSLFLFNLVPIYPLDGGQMARDVLKLLFGEKRADQLMVFISLPLALALFSIGVALFDVILIITGAILLITSLSLSTRASNGMAQGVLYLINRGGFFLKNGDYALAAAEFTKSIRKSPGKPGLYLNRAMAYLNMEDYDLARADLEQAIKIDPRSPLAWNLLGELLDLEGDYDGALAGYSRAIELRPSWAIAYADRGMLYYRMKDNARAVDDLNQAAALGQNSPVTFLLRSMLRYQTGDLPGSEKDSEAALRYAPHWMLMFPEIFLLNFKGHLEWALDYYRRAIERFPNAYQAYLGRADVQRINDRLYWALADYDRAAALAPNQAELYLSRGETYRCLNMAEQAAADFNRALALADKAHIRLLARKRLDKLASL